MENTAQSVRIHILSSQKDIEQGHKNEEDSQETVVFGKCYKKNGIYYIFYDELMEGTDKPTSNRLKIAPKRMELVRKGEVNTKMAFEQGCITREKYHTPYGSMAMGVDTKSLYIREMEDGLEVKAEYLLEINGAYNCIATIQLKITSGPAALPF